MLGQRFAFGPFLLNPDNGTLFRDGELVAIGQRGALLLGALLKEPGRVLTKAELMDAAWPGTAVEESNLSVQIASLRKLLGPSPDGGEWIATVPRVGYRFVGEPEATMPVQTQAAQLGAGHSLAGGAAVPQSERRSRAGLFRRRRGGGHHHRAQPIQNLRGDRAQFDASSTRAARVDVRQVAKELGVRYVLEGSVRRAGDRLRITAQLVEGVTGAHLWAEKFDGAVEDVFDFQDRITESVATVVEPHIQTAEIERSRRERPGSIAAYDIYLRALPKIFSESATENADAYALLIEALALEPDNGLILAHAAFALGHRSAMGWPSIGPDDREKCVELARRALEHAAGDATVMAHCGMSLLHTGQGIRLGNGSRPVRGRSQSQQSDDRRQRRVSRTSIAGTSRMPSLISTGPSGLTPVIRAHRSALTGNAHAHMILGNYTEALAWATRSLALNANFDATYWMLIAANAQLGRIAEARGFFGTQQGRTGRHDREDQGGAACQGPKPVRRHSRRTAACRARRELTLHDHAPRRQVDPVIPGRRRQ